MQFMLKVFYHIVNIDKYNLFLNGVGGVLSGSAIVLRGAGSSYWNDVTLR